MTFEKYVGCLCTMCTEASSDIFLEAFQAPEVTHPYSALCESMIEHQYRLDFAGTYDHTFMLHFPLHPFQSLVILKPAGITHYQSVRKYEENRKAFFSSEEPYQCGRRINALL